jgi:hypothetical protein
MDNFIRYSPLILLVSILLFAVGLSVNHNKENITKAEDSYLKSLQKQDSLNKVIDSLQTEIFYLEDGFDHKEHIYEQALYDCEHRRRLRRQKHKGQLKQQFRYE